MMHDEMVELVTEAEPQPKRRTWAGLAVIAVGAVGVVGWTQLKAPVSRFDQFTAAHQSLMRAFNNRGLSMLMHVPDTKVKFDFLLNEVGKPDPSAMSVSAEISESKEEHEWPQIITTFKAKEGKQEELTAQFDKIVMGFMKTMPPPMAKEMKNRVHVAAGDKPGTVDITVVMPKDAAEKAIDKGMAEGLSMAKPKFHAELKLGRTIKEIFDNADDGAMTLTRGLLASVDTQFASLLFDAATPMMGPNPAIDVLHGFAQFGTKFEFLYKSEEETKEAFGMVPSLSHELMSFKEEFAGQMPEPVQGPMKGLDEVADGLVQLKLTGLPENYQIVADFDNVHIAPLIKAMIEELHPEDAM